jgi:sterol desaturase/sphingolipid hydroxylase (fatty acid hydroxylase superfamily)
MSVSIKRCSLVSSSYVCCSERSNSSGQRCDASPFSGRVFSSTACIGCLPSLITCAATGVGLAALAIPIIFAVHGRVNLDQIMHGYGPASRLPLWLQAAGMLVLGDFLGYWAHRAFHRRRLWRFHAIHHSSTDLDWLSAVRLHPVNDLFMQIATTLPILLLGFSPAALTGLLPVLTFLSILVHANLDWDFGPLGA